MKKLIKVFLIVAITFQFVACENKEDITVFEQNATERLNERSKELSDILLSSEFGWKAVYFTDSTQLGGFTHLMKFKDGKNVDMASDFDENTSIISSEYKIELGSTVSLVFTTGNRIHLLSDSNNFPTAELRGQGYKGDFQFLYYGQENGEIIFRTNRSFEELRFVKATALDWSDLSKNTLMNQNLNEIPRTLFKTLEINDGSNIKVSEIDIRPKTRFATVYEANDEFSFGIAYTPSGITIKPAITVGNQELTVFTYDSTTGNFVATGANNVSATIKINKSTDDYKDLLRGKPFNQFGYFTSFLFGYPTNSSLFESNIEDVYEELGDRLRGKSLNIFLTFNVGSANYVIYEFRDNDENNPESDPIPDIYHYFSTSGDAVNKAIILTSGRWTNENRMRITAPGFLKKIDDQIMNPKGLYVKKESFKIDAPLDVYTFTALTSPAFRITVYAFQ